MYLKPRSFRREGLLHQCYQSLKIRLQQPLHHRRRKRIHSSTLLQRNQTGTCVGMFRRSLRSLTDGHRKHCTNLWRNKRRRGRQLK
ncbi:unnamed protein product [Linum trigynum]|uniref:Uncharacterized protein n=1 Tax=Linum trigynum TaxID=586398 RepID=A0AAV2D7Y4_9ROSI